MSRNWVCIWEGCSRLILKSPHMVMLASGYFLEVWMIRSSSRVRKAVVQAEGER